MITALQNFISKQSKVLFPVLLIVIIVSFVLYLSQGSSVFDLLPDPNREPNELYGVDLNDPDQRRLINMSNRVAADFGAIISPADDIFEKADRQFLQNMQTQLQAAFQANQENIDRNALQQMFGFMQQWPNLPRFVKVREIARSGINNFEFFESSSHSKISLDGQADSWGFLPLHLNHPRINLRFDDFLKSLDPSLKDEANRTRALQFTGQRRGFSARDTETILFSHFRAIQVDRIFNEGGLSLPKEGELDLHAEQFAWDAEALSIQLSDLNLSNPPIARVELTGNLDAKSELVINYAGIRTVFEFSEKTKDQNGTRIFVKLEEDTPSSLLALKEAVQEQHLALVSDIEGNQLVLTPKIDELPVAKPIISSSSAIKVQLDLEKELIAYHDENKLESVFAEPARTFATSLTFSTSDFLRIPPDPDEAIMLAYFERNKDQFSAPSTDPESNSSEDLNGAKGPTGLEEVNSTEGNKSITDTLELDLLKDLGGDVNNSQSIAVTFEQVRDQVRQRIIDGDRIDAERYALSDARDAALAFLDELNQLQDKLRSKYSTYPERRNSTEMSALIAKHRSKAQGFSFSDKDMPMRGAIMGLETRESERRTNRQPLQEVKSLNERGFFTRSVRKAREGYVVFLFDKFVESGPGSYATASFKDLYTGYTDKIKSEALQNHADDLLKDMDDSPKSILQEHGTLVDVERKNATGVRSFYDKRNRSLDQELSPLQDEVTAINDAERDGNATSAQLAKKSKLEEKIAVMRDQQATLNRERSLAIRLLEACSSLSTTNKWEELERSEDEIIFARLLGVYTMRPKFLEEKVISDRVLDLEYARAEKIRSKLVEDLTIRGFAR
jgi:hypothetical protein